MPEHQRVPRIINNYSLASSDEVGDFYLQCSSSFQRYFGLAIEPGYVREILLNISDADCQYVGGGYDPERRLVVLSSKPQDQINLVEVTRRFDKPWKGPLAHELGHALLFQSRDFLTALQMRFSAGGWNRTAHEAFANLAMVTHSVHGDTQQVTDILSGILTPQSLLFSPNRISDHYVLGGIQYEDTAILHFLHLRFGSNALRKTVLAPRGFIAGHFVDPMVEMRMRMEDYSTSRDWIGDRWFNEFDTWLVGKSMGMDAAELSQEAYQWYRQEVPL